MDSDHDCRTVSYGVIENSVFGHYVPGCIINMCLSLWIISPVFFRLVTRHHLNLPERNSAIYQKNMTKGSHIQ